MYKFISNWGFIILVIGIGLLINIFPIIISILSNNWWFMLLYIVVPIIDIIFLIFIQSIIKIFEL